MTSGAYQDFELEISSGINASGAHAYFAKVINSPAGEAPRSQVQFSFSDPRVLKELRTSLENAVLDIDEMTAQGPTSRSEMVLRNFGREAFRSLFIDTAPIRDSYIMSKGAAKGRMRIKLRIEPPDLAGLPWEYLFEEDEVPEYVSLRLPLVRYFETKRTAERLGVKGPLRILGMISDPATADWPKLNVVKERERINKGIDRLQREGRVEFQWVPGGTGKDLMNTLIGQEWHVLHFIGHGGVEEGSGESFIVMVDEDGKPNPKKASDLATNLISARGSIRLVVLNCCDSARVNVGAKFGNPAVGLMQFGVPAVVAMQFPITDNAAIRMSEGFYTALANNYAVDDAVMTGRQYIQDKRSMEWGIPVLYMRSSDGIIFDVDNPPSAATSAPKNEKEDLQRQRTEFMTEAVSASSSLETLQRLTQQGCELYGKMPDDRELAAHLAKLYVELGGIQQRQNQLPKAAASFASALTLDSSKPEYRVRRANLNVLIGLYENAKGDIGEAIKLQPDNAEFYWIKGIICVSAAGPEAQRGALDEAVTAFTTAISKNPLEPRYLMSRGKAYAQIRNYPAAIDDMDRAIAMAPDNVDFVTQRARIASMVK